MKRVAHRLAVGLLVSVIACATVWAQGTAQISGTVKDQSGAVLPGVEITVTQTETNIPRSAVTNETGSYVLPNLAVGPYRLEATLPGFRSYVQNGIVLQVNGSPVINPVLEVGQVNEQVEVQANATMVETRSVSVGQVIENQRILELPLNGRQVTDLIVLAGAAVQTGTSSNRSIQNIPTLSIAGGLATGVAFLLDGAPHNNVWDNLNLPLPFPDALEEFKVETSALSARSGQYSGASVSSVTKSGTNQIHGDLFEFVRNDLFNARNYFATTQSTLKRNQFGGTIGGPIKQNKLFFFGGYQGTTIRQDPANDRVYIPTAQMMAGDFTTVTSPLCRSGGQLNLRAPFVNNRIDPVLFSPAAVNLVSRLPKTSDPCGLFVHGIRNASDEKQLIGKVDYQQSTKHSLFGRYLMTKPSQVAPMNFPCNGCSGPDLFSSPNPGSSNLAQSYVLGSTYLVSPNTVNALRLSVNREAIHRANGDFFSLPDLGVNMYTRWPHFMGLTVTGGFNFGGANAVEVFQRGTSYGLSEDLSIVRGGHQMSLGANMEHWRINLYASGWSPGAFTFNGQTTGLGLADMLIGKPSLLRQAGLNEVFISHTYLGLYAADTWKATPRLTLNYGIRWEPYFPQLQRNGHANSFSEARYAANIHSTVYNDAPIGFYYPGDPGFPGTNCNRAGSVVCQGSGMYKQWWNLSPRFGLAWDPSGDGKTSIRAAYGLGFDPLTAEFWLTVITPPWTNSVDVVPPYSFDDPWRGFPGGNPFPVKPLTANAPFVPYGNYFVTPEDYKAKATQRHTWNLSIQRQIGADWLISSSYIGNETAHIWGSREYNPDLYLSGGPCTLNGVTFNPCSSTANTNERRRLSIQYPNIKGQPIGFLSYREPGGTASYHALLASVQRRAASGVTVGANYTWSRCIGDASNAGAGNTPGTTYTDPTNRRFDRGNCDSDRRQIFNITSVAQTPQFGNPTVRAVATGWRLSGIYRYSTGSYLTVLSGLDRALNGVVNQRAQQVLENPYGDKSLTNYLNPAAFTQPALGTLGSAGSRSIAGPGVWQFDVSLSRVFPLGESRRLEVRAEAYNITNSLRPANPNTTITSSTFGQITTALDPRIMQFALKYVF